MIQDSKITLRAPEPSDVDSLYIWENDRPEAISAPLSHHNVWTYVDNYRADIYADRELRLVIVERSSGEAAGHIDLYEFNPSDRRAGVAVYIAPAYRRRGYARAALALLEGYCRASLGMHQLWAHVAVDNCPSRALFAAAGFSPAGRLRSWLRTPEGYTDVLIFQKLFPY